MNYDAGGALVDANVRFIIRDDISLNGYGRRRTLNFNPIPRIAALLRLVFYMDIAIVNIDSTATGNSHTMASTWTNI